MSYTIEYWTNAPDDVYPTSLVVSPPGEAELLVSSNEDDPRIGTIGRFAMEGDAATFEPLVRAVTSPRFASAVSPRFATPGTLVRKLTVKKDGAPDVVRVLTEELPPDSEFLKAEDEALQIAKAVRRRPKQALALEDFTFKVSPGTASPRVDVAFRLRNPGTEPVGIHHPDQWKAASVSITVTARRSDVPLDKMGNQHQAFVPLDASDLVGPRVPGGQGGLVILTPGRDLELTLQKTIPSLQPGAYEVWIALELSLRDQSGAEIVRAELVSAHQPLRL